MKHQLISRVFCKNYFFKNRLIFTNFILNYLLIFFFVLRMSFLFVSVVLGFTVFLSSFLKLVPFPVLYGVFLYMGVSSIGGIQFIDRLFLLLMPVKHHPSVSYIRRVSIIYWAEFFFKYRVSHMDGVNFKRPTAASFLLWGIFPHHFYGGKMCRLWHLE